MRLEQQDSPNSKTILHNGGGIRHNTGGTSLGDQSTTAFLKQGCFLIQEDSRSWRQAASIIDDLMLREKVAEIGTAKLSGKTTISENPLQGGIRP